MYMSDYDISLSPWCAKLDRVPELAFEVGECVGNGERLVDIARRFGVKRGQLKMWIDAKPERVAAYNAGLSALADEYAMDTVRIADEQQAVEKENGQVYDPDVGRDKLRVDARKWAAGKMDRARWGEQSVQIGINAGGGSLVQILSGMPVYEQIPVNVLTVKAAPADRIDYLDSA